MHELGLPALLACALGQWADDEEALEPFCPAELGAFLPSYLLGCCIICSNCRAAKFMQITGKLIHTSSYHSFREGVPVTSVVHNETTAVNRCICNNAGMQTTCLVNKSCYLATKISTAGS